MLAVVAAVALLVGGISAGAIVASNDHTTVQGAKEPVVEVQTLQSSETKSDIGNF